MDFNRLRSSPRQFLLSKLPNDVSGRYEFFVEINRGDQVAKDFINAGINSTFAQVLFVNAKDDTETAKLNVPAVNRIGASVASKNTGIAYLY